MYITRERVKKMIPKFRAYVKEANKTYEITEIDFGDEQLKTELGDWWSFDEVEIMQSTGVKDKNGVESWEGNYLIKEGCWRFFIKRIENEGCLMAVPVNSVQKTNWKPVSVKELLDKGYVNDSNIYENPELLEETE
ncbi:TPA: YopX family protein [Enterococcus faecalis]